MTDEPLALPKGVDSVADLGTTYTKKQTADYLAISPKTVERLIHRGELEGAHKVPTNNGKTQEWRVPVASVYAYKIKQPATQPDPTNTELEQLRDKVRQLETELREQRTLADERRTQLEQLHLTFRTALTAGDTSSSDTPRRRWRRSRKS